MVTVLPEAEWRQRIAAHEARVRPWVEPRLTRRATGDCDPVDDFLFTYYSFRPSQLLAWHPGLGTACAGVGAHEFLSKRGYTATDHGVTVDPRPFVTRLTSARWIRQLLRSTRDRVPIFGCFGMHEWAMVYRLEPGDVRHASWPLRLDPDGIAQVLESNGARCTHFDAFRFFTDAARPLNASSSPATTSSPPSSRDACMSAWTSTSGRTS